MYKYNRKLNDDRIVALIAIFIAICSIMCNIGQNYFYQRTIKSDEKELNTLNAEYIRAENKEVYIDSLGRKFKIDELKDQYKMLEEAYNELYYSGQ